MATPKGIERVPFFTGELEPQLSSSEVSHVFALMRLQVVQPFEAEAADAADVGPLPRVGPLVNL